MADVNPYDQFDAPPASGPGSDAAASTGPNPYDQFDPSDEKTGSLSSLASSPFVGFNKGVANTLGAPVDVVNWAMGKAGLPVSDAPFGGSESIKKGMGLIGANPDDHAPATSTERYLQAAGEGVGSAVAPELGVQGAIRATGAKLAPAVAEGVGKLVGNGTSGAATAANAGASAVGAMTGEAASDFSPEQYKPYARFFGNLAGGVTAGAGAVGVRAAADAAIPRVKSFVEPMTEAGRQNLASRQLRTSFSDPAAAQNTLEQASDFRDLVSPGSAIGEMVPGSKPTTGQLTGDKGALSLEREIATRQPELYKENDFGTGAEQQNAARTRALQGIQPTGAPEDVSANLNQQLRAIEGTHDAAVAAATRDAQGQAAGIGSGRSPEDIGSDLRDSLQGARDSAKTQEGALWRAVDPNGDLALPATPVSSAAKDIAGKIPETAKPMAGEEANIFETASNLPEVIPFNDLTALRSRVSTAMREELRNSGSTPTYARLTQLRGSIEDAITNAVEHRAAYERQAVARGEMNPDDMMEARLAQAREAFLAEKAGRQNIGENTGSGATSYEAGIPAASGTKGAGNQRFGNPPGTQGVQGSVPLAPNIDQAAARRLTTASTATKERAQTFDQGPVGNVLRRGNDSQSYRMAASAVPGKLFTKGAGGAETVQAFARAAGPDGMPMLHDAVAESLRRDAMTPEGMIDPARFQRWSDAHQDALRALPPDLSRRFQNAANATEAVADAAARRRQAIDDFQDGAIKKVLGVSHPQDVTRAIAGIVDSRNGVGQMSQLAQRVAGNPDAIAGLRKAVADTILEKAKGTTESGTSGIANINAATFQKYIAKNAAVIKAAGFSDQEISNMRAIAADLQRSQRTLSATRLPGQSNTAQDILKPMEKAHEDQHASLLSKLIGGGGAGFAAHGPLGAALGAGTAVGQHLIGKLRDSGVRASAQLVRDAILNPELAVALLRRAPIAPNRGSEVTLANVLGRQSMFATQKLLHGSDQKASAAPPLTIHR